MNLLIEGTCNNKSLYTVEKGTFGWVEKSRWNLKDTEDFARKTSRTGQSDKNCVVRDLEAWENETLGALQVV